MCFNPRTAAFSSKDFRNVCSWASSLARGLSTYSVVDLACVENGPGMCLILVLLEMTQTRLKYDTLFILSVSVSLEFLLLGPLKVGSSGRDVVTGVIAKEL